MTSKISTSANLSAHQSPPTHGESTGLAAIRLAGRIRRSMARTVMSQACTTLYDNRSDVDSNGNRLRDALDNPGVFLSTDTDRLS